MTNRTAHTVVGRTALDRDTGAPIGVIVAITPSRWCSNVWRYHIRSSDGLVVRLYRDEFRVPRR